MFVVMLVIILILGIYLYRWLKNREFVPGKDLGEEYDGIREYDNPTPFGLHIMMGGIISFGLWYVVFGFPLGDYSQYDNYYQDVAKHNRIFDSVWENPSDKTLVAMGESIYNTQCLICHGADARGIDKTAANLLEFGTEEHIVTVIKNGSTGLRKLTPLMPPQWDVLGENDQVREKNAYDAAAYVLSLQNIKAKKGDTVNGKTVFDNTCASCHGFDAKGNGPDGSIPNFASNLTDYASPAYTEEIIRNGKQGLIGKMPAFSELGMFSDTQFKAIALYVNREL